MNILVITRLPVKKPIRCHPNKLDSGSRKGNTCLKSAKFFDQIVLFEPFEIPQPVLNPEESGCGMTPEGFRSTYLTGKRVSNI
jgi:hypothetical protein